METLLNKLEEDFEQSKIHGDGSLLLSKEHVEHYISLLKGRWVKVDKDNLPDIGQSCMVSISQTEIFRADYFGDSWEIYLSTGKTRIDWDRVIEWKPILPPTE
jgi:hypothetical protein